MSGENTDSECIPNDNNNRSRSLLRKVRVSLVGRSYSQYQEETTDEPSPKSLLLEKRRSYDNVNIENVRPTRPVKKSSKTATPVSFSHRLSLLNQVKLHIVGNRKYRRTAPSIWNANESVDYLPLPSASSISETKSSSINEDNQNGIGSSSPEYLVNTNIRTDSETTMMLNDSLNMSTEDEEPQQSQTTEATRTLNSSKLSLNKFKDQITQRARTVITRPPSLTSIFTNQSVPNNNNNNNTEQVYWTEVCIERGKDLSAKDINGTSDPYVKVFYGTSQKYTTSTIEKDLNPVWNEKFTFFTNDLNLPIYFYLFDYDRIGRDEAMGTAKIDLWKLPFEKLYEATLELQDEKRSDGKIGMLQINVTITPKTTEFRDEVLRNLAKQAQMRSHFGRSISNNGVIVSRRTIDVFIIEGRNFKSTGVTKICNPYVKLKFGTNKKNRTQTKKLTLNPKWHQSFMYDTTLIELPPLELIVMDDIGSGDFLGRGSCNLAHLEEEKTHRLSISLEDDAGIIDLFVTITGTTPLQEATNDGDSSSNVALDTIPSKLTDDDIHHYKFTSTLRSFNPISDIGKVEIKIYQARDLSAKDITGKSDPFCIVELDANRLRTHTIYKTLDPAWNKSFIIPVQDIHSVLELTIYDEDTNKTTEFIGKVAIPLLAIKNGEKKWMGLKDRKCLLPVKGAIEIEATFIYTNLKAVLRTFNPRQTAYYQLDGKLSVGAIKQHLTRIQNIFKSVVNVAKFIDYCFQWENPLLSFSAFMVSLVIVWNFELYMLPCTLILLFARNAFVEYRRGRLGKSFASLGDEAISAVVQPVQVEEEILDGDMNTKEQKKSILGTIQGIQDTVVEVQGYIDGVASTLERIKNVFNYSVPWLSVLLIVVLFLVTMILYYIPFRYLVLAFVINKFTKRFRKPKGFIDNNEIADFISRLPSDPELMQYRELKILTRLPTPKKTKRPATTTK